MFSFNEIMEDTLRRGSKRSDNFFSEKKASSAGRTSNNFDQERRFVDNVEPSDDSDEPVVVCAVSDIESYDFLLRVLSHTH